MHDEDPRARDFAVPDIIVAASSPATITTIPRATARLQIHRGFTLDDATDIVPYLAGLGISHVYTSPLLTARPGSMHGYDIVDHRAINPELGGEPALRRLSATLRRYGMGLILDIVPNHMGVGGADNIWWLDVLEWGRSSPYARFFDIDWTLNSSHRIQAPFLGEPYGVCLEAGAIRLRFEAATGRLAATHGEHVFPIAPRQYRRVFGKLVAGFTKGMAPTAARSLPREEAASMQAVLRDMAASPDGAKAIAKALRRFDPAEPEGRRRLHTLLEYQHYTLVWWRTAADEINWRRFFDVTALAGVRAELPAVFEATHALIIRLYGEGLIDGVRIDHIDGLADPRAYCRKLRRRLEQAGRNRPADAAQGAPYIVVEKILASHEQLPAGWLTDGTTGYDFMDQVGALLHDQAGEAPLTELWCELTGKMESYEEAEIDARRLILRDALAGELNATAAALRLVARRDLATRDYSLTAIRRALTEILVHFPVYRLYAGLAGRSATDDRVLAWAIAGAKRTMRAADHPLLDQIDLWLGGEAPRTVPAGVQRRERLRAMVRFAQLSSPVAAKAMEDTAFYRYGRLLSRNEVGANPGQFARSPAAFHSACAARARNFPAALLATATHDHKRGEDVRARLAVLSEIPDEWGAQLRRWMRLNAPLRRAFGDGFAPDPADEIMLYQMLVGAWPLDLRTDDTDSMTVFVDRIAVWQEKALREAKHHTAWVAPDLDYERACRDFLVQTLDPSRVSRLGDEIAAFADRIAPAGAINGLAQTLLKLTVPGVPDLYQGTERWDLSLVDPDNRRPVDYAIRQAFQTDPPAVGSRTILDDWRNGEIKQYIIARALAFRRQASDLFAVGDYHPLSVTGPAADHVVAFARQEGDRTVIAAVTRLPQLLLAGHASPLAPPERWRGTRLSLPRRWAGGQALDVISDTTLTTAPKIPLEAVFANLPVALLSIG
jgi:(1->4)-alpha-D-glucan 1-alpha-D-glucosylmutase